MPASSSERQPSSARNLYSFGITSFFNDTASEMAYWVLPAFLISLGAGPEQLGLIEGVAESVASFAKLFSGYLTDRIDRRKPLVVAGYFVANAVKPLLAIVTSWVHILLIRFTDRLAKGVRGAPRDVMVAESVGKATLGIGLRPDSINGLSRSDCRAAHRPGAALALSELARCSWRQLFLAHLAVLVAMLWDSRDKVFIRRNPRACNGVPRQGDRCRKPPSPRGYPYAESCCHQLFTWFLLP